MINVAVVGVGTMGRNHARVYSEMKGVKLLAVCDINPKTVKEIAKQYNISYYVDYKQLIRSEKLDAVSIAVPTEFHKKVAEYFIKKNIPVLIEKPIASTTANARKLIDLAKKRNVILTVGHIEKFNPAITKLQRLLQKGEFGDILSIVVRRVGLFPTQVKDVGVVTDLAVHDLDIITSLVGRTPSTIYARGGISLKGTHEDHAEIFLDFDNFGCFILVNWVTPVKIRKLSITGTEGHAELDYVTQKLEVFKSNFINKKVPGFKEFVNEFGDPKKNQINIKNQEPLVLELKNFIGNVEGKERLKNKPSQALSALYLSELVIKSIMIGKPVKIK